MKTLSGHFWGTPHTKSGWRSIWLELAFVVMFVLNVAVQVLVFEDDSSLAQTLQPFAILYGIFMLVCGLTGGIFGLRATTRQHERSILVWLAVGVGLFVFLIVLNELTQLVFFLLGISISG